MQPVVDVPVDVAHGYFFDGSEVAILRCRVRANRAVAIWTAAKGRYPRPSSTLRASFRLIM